jgi:phage terminase large subunit-like protein
VFNNPCPLWVDVLQKAEAAKSDQHLDYLNYRLETLYSNPVCYWVQLLRERNEKQLAQQADPNYPYYYNHAAADYAVEFFEKLKHSKGEWGRKPFELAPWQEFDIVRQVFGWLKKESDMRLYRTLWQEVAKKNGKSTFGAGLGLFLLAADNEPGAEVYSVATKLDQARIVHSEAVRMARSSNDLASHLVTLKNNISMPLLGSKYEPVGSDSGNLDGINPSGGVADEIHRWRDRDLWDVLEQSMATRREPLIAALTTAGTGRTSFCFQKREYMLKVLQGIVNDATVYPYIATLDGFDNVDTEKRDDPYDESVWIKANPNLGINIKLSEMREQAAKARTSVAQENAFLRYRLNIWTEQSVRWLPMKKWDQCFGDWKTDDQGRLDVDDMIGRECYGGLDMATTFDICAFVLAFPRPDDKFRILPFFFLPEDMMEERWKRDKVPYPQWAEEGLIELTPGDAIDYDYVRDRIIELSTVYDIREVAFDPHNAIATAQHLEKAGVKMLQHRQGTLSMSAPSKLFEILVRRRDLEHGGNKVLRWMASNVATKTDSQDNIMPCKQKSSEKIDGIVSAVMAVGRASLRLNARSVYEDRGILSIDQ